MVLLGIETTKLGGIMMKILKKFRFLFMLAILFHVLLLPFHALSKEIELPSWQIPVHYTALGDSIASGINSY